MQDLLLSLIVNIVAINKQSRCGVSAAPFVYKLAIKKDAFIMASFFSLFLLLYFNFSAGIMFLKLCLPKRHWKVNQKGRI